MSRPKPGPEEVYFMHLAQLLEGFRESLDYNIEIELVQRSGHLLSFKGEADKTDFGLWQWFVKLTQSDTFKLPPRNARSLAVTTEKGQLDSVSVQTKDAVYTGNITSAKLNAAREAMASGNACKNSMAQLGAFIINQVFRRDAEALIEQLTKINASLEAIGAATQVNVPKIADFYSRKGSASLTQLTNDNIRQALASYNSFFVATKTFVEKAIQLETLLAMDVSQIIDLRSRLDTASAAANAINGV